MKEQAVTIAFPWFRPEQWDQLLRSAVDRNDLPASYREWLVSAERKILQLALTGVQPQRVEIDVGDLVAWCQRHGLSNTDATRSQYVVEISKKPQRDHQTATVAEP